MLHRRHLLPLALSIAAALLLLFLFERLADEMLEGETAFFDASIRAYIHSFASPAMTRVMTAFTNIGNITGVLIAATLAAAILWFTHRRNAALLLATSLAGAALLMFSLKILFHRQRPTPFFNLPTPRDFSFPSGHALVAFTFYGVLAAILTREIHRRPLRILVWTLAAAMAIAIGISRIYLGVHYPSDVLGGYLAAAVWVAGVAAVHLHLRKIS